MAEETNNENLSLADKLWKSILSTQKQVKTEETDLADMGKERTENLMQSLGHQKNIVAVLQAKKTTIEKAFETERKTALLHNKDLQTELIKQKILDKKYTIQQQIADIAMEEAESKDADLVAQKAILKNMQKQKSRQDELNTAMDKWSDTLDDIFEVIEDPAVAGGLFLVAWGDELLDFNKGLMDTASNVGMSKDQMYSMAGTMASANVQGFIMGVNSEKIAGAYEGMAESMHSINKLTGNQIASVAKLSKSLGIGAKETGQMVGHMMTVEGATVGSSKESLKYVSNLARGANLPIGKVMTDVANNMELTSKFGNISVKELGAMAVEAGKLGTSLSEMSAVGEKLLDIDTARNSAMELSVLLGRSINVDKAQQLFYDNDIEGGYKEMLSQLGGINSFNQMDYYQKKAAADMIGISTGELEKQLNLAAGLTATGKKEAGWWGKKIQSATEYGKLLYDNSTTLLASANLIKSMAAGGGGMMKGIKGAAGGIGSKIKGGIKGIFGGGKGEEAADKAKGMSEKLKGVKGTGKEGNVISRFFNAFKTIDWSSIAKAIVGMAGMGLALLAFVPPFKMFAEIPVEGILGGIGTLLAMTLAMKVMGKATGSILKGALAMGVLGLALIPAAFSFSLLAGVDPIAMLAFSGALVILGAAAAGMGFLLPFIAAGSLALALLGVAIIPAAMAFGMLEGIDGKTIIQFGIGVGALGIGVMALGTPMALLGILGMKLLSMVLPSFTGALSLIPKEFDMIGFATGVAALGLAGLTLIPASLGFGLMAIAMTAFAGSLLLLLPLLPVLSVLGGLGLPGFGKADGGGEGASESKGNTEILDKLDELIAVISAGGKVEMDGKAVGRVIQLASGPIGT